MIIYHDILQRLAENGWSSYRLRKEGILPESTLTRIRQGTPLNTETINVICQLCHCQPGDLLEYVEEEEGE
jgi:putative transcriptional regulator